MCTATSSSNSVSVVIPTFNRAFCIRSAIDAVLAQSRVADEIIVVDDGSTDDTEIIVKSYGEKVRYIYQRNAGVSAARNTGVRHAKSKWIAFLDSDDEWHPNKLALQLSEVTANLTAVAHVTDCSISELGDQNRSVFEVRGLQGDFAGTPLRLRPLLDVLASAFFPSAWMVRRDAVLEAGGFNESIVVCEDTDLLSRIALQGPFMVSCFQGACLERRGASDGLSDIYEKNPVRYFESMRHTYIWLAGRQELVHHERSYVRRELAAIHVELALLHAKDGRIAQMRHELASAIFCSFRPRNLAKVVILFLLGYQRYSMLLKHSGRRENVYRRNGVIQGNTP